MSATSRRYSTRTSISSLSTATGSNGFCSSSLSARIPREPASARPDTPSVENRLSRSSRVGWPLMLTLDTTLTTMSAASGSASLMALPSTCAASVGVSRRLRATSA
jgi:hypothetical protein